MESKIFRVYLHEPWFTCVIKELKKNVSLCLKKFKDIKENDTITFYNNNPQFGYLREIDVKVYYLATVKSPSDYLYLHTLYESLPGVVTIADGIELLSKMHDNYPIIIAKFTLITKFIRKIEN